MSDRGMKKWVAYKSLVEQDQFLATHRNNRTKRERPIILEDKIEEINETLSYSLNRQVELSYFQDGYIYKISGEVKKIDLTCRLIYINSDKINLLDITDINLLD